MVAEAKSSEDLRIYMSDGTAPAKLTPTTITKAKPAVMTATAPPGGWLVGAPVYMQGTGFPELDNHFFTVGNPVTNTVALVGSDTTASTATLATTGAEALVYDSAALTSLCLSSVTYNLETPGTVNVGTYCNPKATLPSTAGAPGTMTLAGYIDVQDSAYPAVYAATKDGQERLISILLGKGQGEIVQTATLAGMTWDLPMGDGGMAWTATANLKTDPEHIFDSTAPVAAKAPPAPTPAPAPEPAMA